MQKRDQQEVDEFALRWRICPNCNFHHENEDDEKSVLCQCGFRLCFGCLTIDKYCHCDLRVVLEPNLNTSVNEVVFINTDTVGKSELEDVIRLFSFLFENFNYVLKYKELHKIVLDKSKKLMDLVDEKEKVYFTTWFNILKLFYDQYAD